MRLRFGKNTRLAAFFLAEQVGIASQFAEISNKIPRWRDSYVHAVKSGELDAYIAAEFQVYPQYLEKAFNSGDGLWLDLYVGEKLKQGYSIDGKFDEAKAQLGEVLEEETAYLMHAAKVAGLDTEVADLEIVLSSVRSVATAKATRSLKILWIADCIYLDIQSFLASRLASASLALVPDFVTTKNPIERYEQTAALLNSKSYDAVFYCPFSYENSNTYSSLLNGRRAASNALSATRLADEEFSTVESMIHLLTEKAESPVFVHNASGVMRHVDTWKEAVRDLMTRPARMLFCATINNRLDELSRRLNAEQPVSQMIVIDEFGIAKANGLKSSGSYFHCYGLQHPAKLGLFMVETYLDSLITIAALHKKKVVVCDLDNTLWEGLVGEGPVDHYRNRQSILKSLKSKGVLLAVNSKNDAANVTWDGALLNNDDFAGIRINWKTKTENIGELAEEMNLNSNSFVFVDDRADERAIVSSVYPDTVTLDAEDPATWRRLALWERVLSGVGVIDRTQLYKKRQEREQFVSSSPQLSKETLFGQLELKCSISLADTKSLSRIAELLNRTNQFNTTGRRTSLKEVQSWRQDSRWSIYVAKANDRFGDMGIISVLVTHEAESHVEIEAFVLSCRVFGYGIETALLKALTDANPGKSIEGVIIPTAVNQPCQSVYAAHNFHQDGDRWIYDRGAPPIANKSWLTVEYKIGAPISA
jgi:FkbH-like protein